MEKSMLPVTALLMVTLLLCPFRAAAVEECVKEGQLSRSGDWFDNILSAKFGEQSNLEFTFHVEYDERVATENPIQIVLFREDAEKGWNSSTTCEQKVETAKDSNSGEVITLDVENKWSGCKRNGSLVLLCSGGRRFGISDETPMYVVSVARCTSATIQMDYKFTFTGYYGCNGREELSSTTTATTTAPTTATTAAPTTATTAAPTAAATTTFTGGTRAAAEEECVREGELSRSGDWFDNILSAKFGAQSDLEFTFQVKYDERVATENPIQIVIFREDAEKGWNMSTSCEKKLETAKHSKSGEVITLDPENKWSGCKRNGSLWLVCSGRRGFGISDEMPMYVVSVARCTSATIQMEYKFTLTGYYAGCNGKEELSSTTAGTTAGTTAATTTSTRATPSAPPSHLTAGTVMGAINSSIILIALLAFICVKCKIPARITGSQPEIGMNTLHNNEY